MIDMICCFSLRIIPLCWMRKNIATVDNFLHLLAVFFYGGII